MHMMPASAEEQNPHFGAVPQLYTRETGASLWRVKMTVEGLLWWPEWTGYAFDSQHATRTAIASFQGQHGPLTLIVKDVFQVGA